MNAKQKQSNSFNENLTMKEQQGKQGTKQKKKNVAANIEKSREKKKQITIVKISFT